MLVVDIFCSLVCFYFRDVKQKEADVEPFNRSDEGLSDGEGNTERQSTEKDDESPESTFTQIIDPKKLVDKTTEQKMTEEKITKCETSIKETSKKETPVDKIIAQKTLDRQTTGGKISLEDKTKLKPHVEIKSDDREKQEVESDDSLFLKVEKRSALLPASSALKQQLQEEQSMQTSVPEKLILNSSSSNNSQKSDKPRVNFEDQSISSERDALNFKAESLKTEQLKDAPKATNESTIDCASIVDDEVVQIKLEPHCSFLANEENENSNDGSVCDSNSSELQEQTDSLALSTVAPNAEAKTSSEASKSSDPSQKIRTSKGPKIKRTLSRAERLSRTRKAKSGLSGKMGLSLKVSPSAKQQGTPVVNPPSKADTPGIRLPSKGPSPAKAGIKSEKTVQRRRSFKGGRSSSISPRGYGYSMAFMDIEKPSQSGTIPEEDSEVAESGTGLLKISTHGTSYTTSSPTSPTVAGTPTENQTAPKKQTYQAKKFRLDQITGKLSAQRQSEAQAAAHSPSAFQLTKHHSSPTPPPTLSPSPPANPPYPRESYPPPGPPPLLYSPMPGSCCPTPHHPHMYGPHPGHGMRLPAGHMHPHPDYPPPSSGYMLYAHGMHYPPPGPCIGQCKCNHNLNGQLLIYQYSNLSQTRSGQNC